MVATIKGFNIGLPFLKGDRTGSSGRSLMMTISSTGSLENTSLKLGNDAASLTLASSTTPSTIANNISSFKLANAIQAATMQRADAATPALRDILFRIQNYTSSLTSGAMTTEQRAAIYKDLAGLQSEYNRIRGGANNEYTSDDLIAFQTQSSNNVNYLGVLSSSSAAETVVINNQTTAINTINTAIAPSLAALATLSGTINLLSSDVSLQNDVVTTNQTSSTALSGSLSSIDDALANQATTSLAYVNSSTSVDDALTTVAATLTGLYDSSTNLGLSSISVAGVITTNDDALTVQLDSSLSISSSINVVEGQLAGDVAAITAAQANAVLLDNSSTSAAGAIATQTDVLNADYATSNSLADSSTSIDTALVNVSSNLSAQVALSSALQSSLDNFAGGGGGESSDLLSSLATVVGSIDQLNGSSGYLTGSSSSVEDALATINTTIAGDQAVLSVLQGSSTSIQGAIDANTADLNVAISNSLIHSQTSSNLVGERTIVEGSIANLASSSNDLVLSSNSVSNANVNNDLAIGEQEASSNALSDSSSSIDDALAGLAPTLLNNSSTSVLGAIATVNTNIATAQGSVTDLSNSLSTASGSSVAISSSMAPQLTSLVAAQSSSTRAEANRADAGVQIVFVSSQQSTVEDLIGAASSYLATNSSSSISDQAVAMLNQSLGGLTLNFTDTTQGGLTADRVANRATQIDNITATLNVQLSALTQSKLPTEATEIDAPSRLTRITDESSATMLANTIAEAIRNKPDSALGAIGNLKIESVQRLLSDTLAAMKA